jgi:Protein of unknown function (DUF3892)
MATRITCIIPDENDPNDRVAGVGGLHGWTEWENQIIGEIEDGANYYVEVDNQRVEVVVAEHERRKYLSTNPEKDPQNHLLSLPHCS